MVRLKHSSVEPALYGVAASGCGREMLRVVDKGRNKGGWNCGIEGRARTMEKKNNNRDEVSIRRLVEEKRAFAGLHVCEGIFLSSKQDFV